MKENDLKDAYVRLTIWQGEDNKVKVRAIAKPYRFPGKEDYQKGFRVMLFLLLGRMSFPLFAG